MSTDNQSPKNNRQQAIEAIAIFSALMHARNADDLQNAAKAHRDLERLGVVVRFQKPNQQCRGGGQ